MRLALYWNAADLTRPDKALFRELLSAFVVHDRVRLIAWHIWSHADHRTGLVPPSITPGNIAEALALNRRKVVYPALSVLADRWIVCRERESRRRPYRFRVNIAALYRRRRRAAPAQPDLLAPSQSDLLAAGPADAPPAPVDPPAADATLTTERQRVGIASMAAELGLEVDVPADRVAASAVYAELKQQVELVRAARRSRDPAEARRILEAQRYRR